MCVCVYVCVGGVGVGGCMYMKGGGSSYGPLTSQQSVPTCAVRFFFRVKYYVK
jgi:hypothetical protein